MLAEKQGAKQCTEYNENVCAVEFPHRYIEPSRKDE
jgi:hypothetical protein